MTRTLFVIFSGAILLSACHRNRPATGLTVLHPPLQTTEHLLHLSDIADSLSYIKLATDTSNLIGVIDKIIPLKDRILIVDKDITQTIYIFDKSGKFIRKIGHVGQGPGEIANIHCFTVSDSLVFIYPFSRNGSLTVYDMRDNSFVKEFSLKWPVFFSWTIDVMGDCLVYYPGTVYLPDNSKTFISACVANGKGETLMEQIPYLSSGDKEIVQLSSDPSWLYRGRSNVYSFINDTIYGITCDSIFPRYHLSLGKYKLPSGRYDPTHDYGWGDFVLMQSVYETKEFLFLKFWFDKKLWFSRYDKKTEKIDSWEQTPFKAHYWMILDAPGITNDIDGSQSFKDFDNVGENCFHFAITPDNLDQVRRNVTEAKVKFPEKQAELLKLLDEMGEDDNPIIAFYKLKD